MSRAPKLLDASAVDPETLVEQARSALESGDEEQAIPILRQAAERQRSASLWQWTGLLERSIDEHGSAIESFAQAASLAPNDPLIAHGRARTAMEAGLSAVELYELARSLAPSDGAILIGLVAARAAEGDGERAAQELSAALDVAPFWPAGHQQLSQLMATLGRSAQATDSIEQALRRFPRRPMLWETLLNIQLRRGAYESLREIVERARAAGVQSPDLPIYEAIHAAQFDEQTFPPVLFDQAPASAEAILGSWRIRHLLRTGAPEAALAIIDRELQRSGPSDLWAYAATAWRLTGDPRSEWLEGDSRLVGIFDLSQSLPPNDSAVTTLRALHVARGEYLDQSVRGGTQTDGPLFSRVDPVIRRIRSAVVGAVEDYVRHLPPPDPRHPLLAKRRDRRVRFAGSWSVRLRSQGHHSNHVHPQGWISSALYLALPARIADEPEDAGWFTLGAPDEKLGVELPPWRRIEPRIGQLVLFPSWMWHGTLPFAEGERLTVAFDVAPPQ